MFLPTAANFGLQLTHQNMIWLTYTVSNAKICRRYYFMLSFAQVTITANPTETYTYHLGLVLYVHSPGMAIQHGILHTAFCYLPLPTRNAYGQSNTSLK